MNKAQYPGWFQWGGGGVPYRWSFGWWSGRDGDLICVKPRVKESDPCSANWVLSPVCRTRAAALLGFVLKYLVVCLDQNVFGVS